LLTGAQLAFSEQDLFNGSYPLVVAALSRLEQTAPLTQRCLTNPCSHFVACCASSPIASALRSAPIANLTVLEPTQEAALIPVIRLAREACQSRQALTRCSSPLSSILGFARLVLNTQLSSSQREYLEGILSSAQAVKKQLGPLPAAAQAQRSNWLLTQRPGLPGPPLRILVADDNAVSQALAVLVLEEQGHEITLAGDGEAVLALLQEQSFDLILMDVLMPRLDGYLTTRAIREQERDSQRRMPVIAVTAHGREGDAEMCLAAGMDGFVAKPIQQEDLFEVMQRVLGWSDEQPAANDQRILNRQGLERRLGGREDQLHRVIRQFLEMLPRQLDEVYQSFSRGDQEALTSSLHRLKCSALAFEAPRILDPISRLELAARRPLGLAESGTVLANLRRELDQLTRELIELDRSLTQTESSARLPLPSNWPGLDRPLRVLLAEDNPVNQTLVLTLLEEQSCDIELAENGQQAVDACAAGPFDVILMDVQMPILDGLEAMALIRQREVPQGRYTPIVVMTASTRDGDGSEYLAAGASHFLCKPIQEDDLLAVLQNIVSHQVPIVAPHPESDIVDVEALGQRLQYKLERLARLSQVFNQVLPGHLSDLQEAVARGRGRDLEASAHRFKTTLKTIEARTTLGLAQQLEAMGRADRLEGSQQILETISLQSRQIQLKLEQLLAEAAILAQL
jgi:CheY-like chemotaxis protein/HPt (histidine-containing phosphotransfer) domain-containing protein